MTREPRNLRITAYGLGLTQFGGVTLIEQFFQRIGLQGPFLSAHPIHAGEQPLQRQRISGGVALSSHSWLGADRDHRTAALQRRLFSDVSAACGLRLESPESTICRGNAKNSWKVFRPYFTQDSG
jgi:hypothetical protein